MIILTSPAKTFQTDRTFPKDFIATQPRFLNEASLIVRSLRLYSKRGLVDALEVSESLADLNYNRYKQWEKSHTYENSKPALFSYFGDVFQELDLDSYGANEFEYTKKSMRIISGLYGLLAATDLIQPYRCDMTLNISLGSSEDLPAFWKDKITRKLQEDVEEGSHSVVLNLLSKEYSKSIDFSALNVPVLSVDFKQDVNGRIKNYGLLSKRARGMMIDYCIKNHIGTLEDLKKFDMDGYALAKETKNTLAFIKK